MAWVSKLLGIWLAERTVTSTTPIFMRLLAALAAIAVLAAMASALLALMLAGVLWILYDQLLAHGLTQPVALLSLIGIVFILLAVLVVCMQSYIDRIRRLSHRIIVGQGPVTGGLSSIAESFLRGWNASSPGHRR